MVALLLIATGLCVFYLIIKCIFMWWSDRNAPPGPKGLPLVGYAPFLRSFRLHEEVGKISTKYGDILSIRVAGTLLVFLNSPKAIRQAFVTQGDAFSSRPTLELFKLLNMDGLGIFFAKGKLWSEHRRFALKVFKDFGVGKSIMEDIISEEMTYIKDAFQKHIGQPFNPRVTMAKSVSNVICRLVFNERPGYEDVEFEKYLKAGNENLQSGGVALNILLLPILFKVPILRSWIMKNYWQIQNMHLLDNYSNAKVLKHLERFQENSDPKDYIDAYLQEKQRLDKLGESHSFSIKQLNKITGEFFVGGTDTTAATLSWALLFMAIHKDSIQTKVFRELQRVVGTRAVKMADKKNLPYTEATINEVLRFRSIAPLTVPHVVNEKTQLCGYTIPPGALVMGNIYLVNRDEKIWRYPYRFEPENFLSTDANGGLILSGVENLLSFSVGKRSCLGEGLSRMELFLFFSRIMQEFEFSMSNNQSAKIEDILQGSTAGGPIWSPIDFFVEITPR